MDPNVSNTFSQARVLDFRAPRAVQFHAVVPVHCLQADHERLSRLAHRGGVHESLRRVTCRTTLLDNADNAVEATWFTFSVVSFIGVVSRYPDDGHRYRPGRFDGMLPLDFNERSIVRVLFHSGQYRLARHWKQWKISKTVDETVCEAYLLSLS